MTWEKIFEVCNDYPDELGRVKAELSKFLSTDCAHKSYLKC